MSDSQLYGHSPEDPHAGRAKASIGSPGDAGGRLADLVVGLVGAVGTDLQWIEGELLQHLDSLGFDARTISLSSLLREEYGADVLPRQDAVEYDRYVWQHMTGGNVLRAHWSNAEALALLAVEQIRRHRDKGAAENGLGFAFVLRSLKRPEEARLLSEVYRGQFVLIGCHTPRETRIRQLAESIARSRGEGSSDPHRAAAELLANRDEHELGPLTADPDDRRWLEAYGQSVEGTFPLADAYVNLEDRGEAGNALTRFCDLLLGAPFVSPSKEEYAMFHAGAAAVRSSDLSRQVGAAIATPDGDIIAVGCNDAPRAGGGLYWEGDIDDARDFRLGLDGNQDQRDRALHEVFNVLKARGLLTNAAVQAGSAAFGKALDDTRVDGLIEFTRSTHAEMAALLDAARRGVSVEGAILYSSTFPCHNCAKHIITAGISRVVFIEPYPKSLARQLHGDAIAVDDPSSDAAGFVHFQHFAGVAPVNYFTLFKATGKRKDGGGAPLVFSPKSIEPKLRATFNRSLSTTEEETIARLKDLRDEHGSPTRETLENAPRITREPELYADEWIFAGRSANAREGIPLDDRDTATAPDPPTATEADAEEEGVVAPASDSGGE